MILPTGTEYDFMLMEILKKVYIKSSVSELWLLSFLLVR
jgi:hypothetical protein